MFVPFTRYALLRFLWRWRAGDHRAEDDESTTMEYRTRAEAMAYYEGRVDAGLPAYVERRWPRRALVAIA